MTNQYSNKICEWCRDHDTESYLRIDDHYFNKNGNFVLELGCDYCTTTFKAVINIDEYLIETTEI